MRALAICLYLQKNTMNLIFNLSSLPIDIGIVGRIALIIVLAMGLHYLGNKILKKMLLNTEGTWHLERTEYVFLRRFITGFISFAAVLLILFVIPAFKDLAFSLSISASIITALILFTSQQTLANLINGILLVVSKPFNVGDIIEFGKIRGKVEDITLRHVVLRDVENKQITIPNSMIGVQTIINYTSLSTKILERNLDFTISSLISRKKSNEILQKTITKCFGTEVLIPVYLIGASDKGLRYSIGIPIHTIKDLYPITTTFYEILLHELENYVPESTVPLIYFELPTIHTDKELK